MSMHSWAPYNQCERGRYSVLSRSLPGSAECVQARKLYETKVRSVDEFMRSKQLPVDLRYSVRDYYQIRFAAGKMFDEHEIMSDLSPSLREQVLV